MNSHFFKLVCLLCAFISQNLYAMELSKYDYLIKEEHARECDDRKRELFVKPPLFMALCLNAQADQGRSQHQFKELLERVRVQTINVSSEEIALTQKEFFAGLIAHIKYLNECLEGLNGPVMAVAINDQKTYLQFGPNMWNPNNIKASEFENMPVEKLAALTLKYKSLLSK